MTQLCCILFYFRQLSNHRLATVTTVSEEVLKRVLAFTKLRTQEPPVLPTVIPEQYFKKQEALHQLTTVKLHKTNV